MGICNKRECCSPPTPTPTPRTPLTPAATLTSFQARIVPEFASPLAAFLSAKKRAFMHRMDDMPSFLTDENTPIYSHSGGIVDFYPDHHIPLSAKDPRSANVDSHKLPSTRSRNRSYAESSSHSTHTDLSDPAHPNESATRPTSMSSLANGKPARGASMCGADEPDLFATEQFPPLDGDHASDAIDATISHKLKPHIPAPSRPPPSIPSSRPAGAPPKSPTRAPPPVPDSPSTLGVNGSAPVTPNGVGMNGVDSASSIGLSPLETIPSGAPVPMTGTMSDVDRRESYSGHRFPAHQVYQNTNGGASTSTPALNPPPNAGLKHRHTLEVPKAAPARASRDGAESAYTSGRFSPTTSGRRPSLSLGRRNTKSVQSDVVRDEVMPDEDALRWAEAYRQKRAKKKQVEDDDRVLVGTKVDENHQNWVTAYNMLTGIRVSVSRTNAKNIRELTDADFEAKQKSTFDIAGNELVPSAKYDFKFKDYAPWVFRTLRNKFKLDPADYLMSLTGKYILSELGSPGKSGSFFYFSRDYKYIIKTIHHAEHKFLRKILKDYYQHVLDNPNTLLSQFYGLHRVKMPWGKKIHFVVMNNLFPPHRDIHMTFDLKGSTIGRDYEEDLIANNPRATLKDLNWMRRKRNLELGIQKKRLFLEQLQRDVRLLQRLGIMDYSLLTGIHDLQRGNEENLRDKTLKVFNPGGGEEQDPAADPHTVLMRTPSKLENEKKARELRQMLKAGKPIPVGLTSERMPDTLDEPRKHSVFYSEDGGYGATHENNTPANEVYYLGVIDCLTHYGMIKKLEHFWKGLSSDRSKISALPPQEYGDRFYRFVEGVTMSHEEAVRAQIAQEEAHAITAAAEERERVGSWNSSGNRRSNSNAPPVPTYNPPPPPPAGIETPESRRLEGEKAGETELADRTSLVRRDSPNAQTILTVVEEAAESSTSAHSKAESSRHALTPAGSSLEAPDRPPPSPPKCSLGLKNVDSGYSEPMRPQPSRESLEKALPPIPYVGALGRPGPGSAVVGRRA